MQRPPDPPEVLARYEAESDLVDLCAAQLRRSVGQRLSMDELRSFGREGLLQAARTFDPTFGVPFRRWANLRVRGAMLDGFRASSALPRGAYRQLRAMAAADALIETYDAEDAANPASSPEDADARLSGYLAGMATAIALGTMGATSPDTTTDSPEQQVADAQLAARLKAIVDGLPDPDRTIVERHYYHGDQLDEAAAAAGLSKSWGSRVHARAIEKIAKALRREGGV